MEELTAQHLDIIYPVHHDVSMRTTLTLDEDVATLLNDEMKRTEQSFKRTLNEALRRGLRTVDSNRKPFKVRPHSFGPKPGVDLDRLNQLSDELETEAFVANDR